MRKFVFVIIFLMGGLTYTFSQQSGSCGENLTWTLDEDGTLTISGTGEMYDYGDRGGPWGNKITQLIIEEGITHIGAYAFYMHHQLTGTLSLPASLTSIGDHAFQECEFTGTLTLPDGLTSVGTWAFSECNGFTGNLTFPTSLTNIGDGAFSYCGFTELTIPEEWTRIGAFLFEGCSGFTGDLSLPAGLTSIGEHAFTGCSGFTGNLILPEGLASIEESTFADCSGFTGNLTLPASLTSIEGVAFAGCSGFTGNLTLPANLTSIGVGAFELCSGFTDTLALPEGLRNIGSYAFVSCGFSVVLNENKTPIVIDANVFKNLSLSDVKLCVPVGSGTAYSQFEVWKEFAIEEYGVGITPSFSISGGTIDCGTEISISTKPEAELYYGLGKNAAPTLRYIGPIVVNDTTYISAYSRVWNVYSDTIRATYIPEHIPTPDRVDWDWSAEHKATLLLTCPRCQTDIKPAVSLSEELTQEATEEEDGLKTYTATAIANEVTYKSINREVLPRLVQPIHDTVVKTDTITITEVKTDTIIITDTVYIEVGTGNTVNGTMQVKLYPNPTNGSFTVEAEDDAYLQIYNAAGICIQSKRMQGGRFTGTLPSSGLYFIKLTARNRTYTKRLVVK